MNLLYSFHILILVFLFYFQIERINACNRGFVPQISVNSHSQVSDAYSTVDLVHLANFERKFYDDLAEIIGRLLDEDGLLKKYTSDYEQTSTEGTSHLPDHVHPYDWATVVASHPFLAFRLIRRMLVDLPLILKILEQQKESVFLNKIRSRLRYLKWPTIADKEDIMSRILQIQTVYDFDIEMCHVENLLPAHFGDDSVTHSLYTIHTKPIASVRGKYSKGMDDKLGGRLLMVHCVEIGRHAMSIGKYASAVEWMNIAIRKSFIFSEVGSISLDEVAKELSIVVDEHDRMLDHHRCRHSGNLNNLWEHDLFQVPVPKLKSFKADRLRHSPQHPNDISFRAIQLCNGVNRQPHKVRAKLKCWYDKKRFSFSGISPMKMELLNKKPYLVRIYDFVSPKGVRNILDKTFITLNELGSVNSSNSSVQNKNIHGTRRRHDSAIIAMEDKEVGLAFKNISLELERFVNPNGNKCSGGGFRVLGHAFGNSDLQLETSDAGIELKLHVANFTSVIIFLNQVELGGLTVFPNIGISVEPVPGSALVWWNLVGGGKKGIKYAHMECPVILGEKWVATKIIRADSII